jgi:hypothetical protein
MKQDLSARVCVIGAGSSGIAAAKNLLQVGLRNIVVYEKNDGVGGNWLYSPHFGHSSVYETTHIISSKTLSQYDDFPMPDHYPDYPSHQQILAYFQGYAQHFGVMEYIRFNTEIAKAEKQPDETWRVTLKDGMMETFDYLIVANGHHWDPRMPSYPGEFTGEMLHSHAFKTAAPYRDKRVLVIGGGNSACDIAVESSRVSAFTAISMRRGYYIVPKFTMGKPTDVMASKFNWLPRPLYKAALRLSLWLNIGDYRDYGLQRPKHGLLEAHVTMNSELLYYVRHGKIHPRRDVARFVGRTVHFGDGMAEDYDVVICATGFNISFPFFDKALLDFSDGKEVPLYLLTFHPDHPSLFFVGLVQPLGSIWPLGDLQSKLAANAIIGNYAPPANMRERINRDLDYRRRNYVKSPRHTVEVEYFQFRNALLRDVPESAPEWSEQVREPESVVV